MVNNNPDVTTPVFAPLDEPGLDNDPFTHLTRVFVYFLQNLFRDFPAGYGMRWSPNEEMTELVISAEKPRLDAIGRSPHITCVLGAARWANVSLDQFLTHRASDGRRTHMDLLPCTMAYHCQAKEGLVARRIAWNASKYTNVFRRLIMRGGGLHHVAPNHEIGAESGPSVYTGPTSEEEIVSVVVTVPFYWQDGWRITKPAHLWRKLRMTFEVEKSRFIYSAGRTNLIRRPTVKGVPVISAPIEQEIAFTQVVLESNYGEEEE